MLRAERRRRADLVAAALIVLVVLLGITVVAVTSRAAHTTLIPVSGPALTAPAEPTDVPATLTESWTAPSPATLTPTVAGSVVVTGEDSTVLGRDPLTGAQRWLYRRDVPLCTVGAGWSMALAVYRNGSYCGDVTAIRPDTGTRGPQRNSDVPPDTQLLWDGDLVTATGWNHLETWRSDLVKTLEYGLLRADIEPDTQPRPNCRHTSTAVTSGLVGVLERCPHESGDRLTLLRPDNADSDRPDEEFSTLIPSGGGSMLVALSADREAVLLADPSRLSIRDSNGNEVANYPLALPAQGTAAPAHAVMPTGESETGAGEPTEQAANLDSKRAPHGMPVVSEDEPGKPALDVHSQVAPGGVARTTCIPGAVLWWTGSSTVALDADDLHPLWTVPNTLGPGTLLADQPVVPTLNAELVINPSNGAVVRSIPVNRGSYRGPVATSALGPVLLEQRGRLVVALR